MTQSPVLKQDDFQLKNSEKRKYDQKDEYYTGMHLRKDYNLTEQYMSRLIQHTYRCSQIV